LAHEHAASSLRITTEAVTGDSIYQGKAYNLHVVNKVCYREVPDEIKVNILKN